jgi:23S rRNA U2552 (ribose-2'-O)-methylase RlmE/FtsJ
VLKVLEGPEAQVVARRIRGRFERSGGVRPAAAREGTTERYLVAQGYLGPAGD